MTTAIDPRRPTSRARILVIDDDAVARQSISDTLEHHGYEVHTMVSAMGASHVILTKQVDAVIVDLNMPDMTGDQFVTLIRSWDRIRELPTILITGEALATLETLRAALPGTLVISKSQLRGGLIEGLRRLLTQRA